MLKRIIHKNNMIQFKFKHQYTFITKFIMNEY